MFNALPPDMVRRNLHAGRATTNPFDLKEVDRQLEAKAVAHKHKVHREGAHKVGEGRMMAVQIVRSLALINRGLIVQIATRIEIRQRDIQPRGGAEEVRLRQVTVRLGLVIRFNPISRMVKTKLRKIRHRATTNLAQGGDIAREGGAEVRSKEGLTVTRGKRKWVLPTFRKRSSPNHAWNPTRVMPRLQMVPAKTAPRIHPKREGELVAVGGDDRVLMADRRVRHESTTKS